VNQEALEREFAAQDTGAPFRLRSTPKLINLMAFDFVSQLGYVIENVKLRVKDGIAYENTNDHKGRSRELLAGQRDPKVPGLDLFTGDQRFQQYDRLS